MFSPGGGGSGAGGAPGTVGHVPPGPGIPVDGLESGGRTLEKFLHADAQAPSLQEKISRVGTPSLSGLGEPDYPTTSPVSSVSSSATSIRQLSDIKKVPLPAELVEQFGHMQCNCAMGLFTPIERAWLTIDSDIYLWQYEDCGDLAYFDGLSDTILSVALVKPKKDIFQPHIKYLLCLTTAVEIVLLGVSFGADSDYTEMHLLPEPLFSLPTDATYMQSLAGTALGRLFLGGKDGCLYEFAYQADEGWFGKKATKINHSQSKLSFLVPTFINAALYEEDSIEQLEVDDSRHLLYARSAKGVVQLFELGYDGQSFTKVFSLTQEQIVAEASKIAINVDRSNFHPIVGISVLPTSESPHLVLVAVTANGVRFYFGIPPTGSHSRSYSLQLQHIRLPPGFTATSVVPKPTKVHMSYYRQGTLLMASAQSEDSELLWLLSSDLFPFQSLLMEGQSTINLEGRVWAMDEVPQTERLSRLYKDSFGAIQPPLAVMQHTQQPRKFVLISSQGTQIVSKLRPVDHLRQLLIEHGGPDSEVVKAFFSMHGETQAAATCLILACSQALKDTQIAEWATRAFFLYGGEPKLHYTQQPANPNLPATSSFHPQIISTPAPQFRSAGVDISLPFSPVGGGTVAQSQHIIGAATEMFFSAKHDGLYLYFSRLVRPIWMTTLVVPGSPSSNEMKSSITSEEIEWIMTQLNDLNAFLERNAQFTAVPITGSGALPGQAVHAHPLHDPSNPLHQHHSKSQQEALVRERQSLLFLQQLVAHCLQVLGLWKIVHEQQFHVVVSKELSQEEQNVLRGMYFRDLIISSPGKDLCGRLVHGVVNYFLNDDTSTDAISHRLRQMCPALYNSEDAISTKAHEILIAARQQNNIREKERMLSEAVAMCKDIASSRLNLDVLSSHLMAVHCYNGVVEVCLAAANKRDPQNLALHYYKNGEPHDDHQGLQAFLRRMECYKHILDMLKRLLDTSASSAAVLTAPVLPKSPGPPPPPDPNHLPPTQAGKYANEVFDCSVQSDDQLFHVALYRWLIEQRLFERLLNVRSSFLEDFLTRGTKKQPESLIMFDLLWKFYEKTRSYAAAAKILAKLADRHSSEVSLQQRIEYLSRAIMCVKSGELGGEAGRMGVGELLHELEEKMEVARVQLQILEAFDSKPKTHDVTTALAKLNAALLDISSLYQEFADPFDLWECQLSILHCSGHDDQPFVERLWENILNDELRRSSNVPSNARVSLLSNKVKSLGKLYASSSKYFPMEFITRKLELFSCELGYGDIGWVFQTLLQVGVPLPRILETYNRLYTAADPVWLTQGAPNHLLYVLAKILSTFADSQATVNYNERRQFTVICLDAVVQYLGNLYSKHDCQLLVQEFRGIQAKLERM